MCPPLLGKGRPRHKRPLRFLRNPYVEFLAFPKAALPASQAETIPRTTVRRLGGGYDSATGALGDGGSAGAPPPNGGQTYDEDGNATGLQVPLVWGLVGSPVRGQSQGAESRWRSGSRR